MTTVVYDHKSKILAVDQRVLLETVILTDESVDKFVETQDGIWFFCGKLADYNKLVQIFNGEQVESSIECAALYFDKKTKEVYHRTSDKNQPYGCKLACSVTLGSGEHFALAALDHGKNAIEAIKYTATRDICTGSNVLAYSITEEKWI
jgi:hypothetical protein